MPLNHTSYILSMIFVHNRIPHCFMLFAFIIFPSCVHSASNSPRSPPSSPDWDVLLSVPINEDLLHPFSQQKDPSYHGMQRSGSKAKLSSNDEHTTTLRPKSFSLAIADHGSNMALKDRTVTRSQGPKPNPIENDQKTPKKKRRIADLTGEEKEARAASIRESNAIRERRRQERLKLPENAEELATIISIRRKSNLAYRRKLVSEVQSGTASSKRKQSYSNLLQRDRERKRKKYHAGTQSKRS